jgi:hypothetical protein
MNSQSLGQLTKALSDVEHALSMHTDKWHVLQTASQPIQATAARQIAIYFHPKAEIGISPELHAEVERLVLSLGGPDAAL